MRNISFFLTKQQFIDGSKDVTRRKSWVFLKPGDVLMAVEKAQGLKKGEKIKKLGPLQVLDANPEPLNAITQNEVIREGFFDMNPAEFIDMFCKSHKGVTPETVITRIEFKKL